MARFLSSSVATTMRPASPKTAFLALRGRMTALLSKAHLSSRSEASPLTSL